MGNNQDYNEWDVTRKLIDKFDGYITDLRRYGFTFITGILTAQAILLPTNNVSPGTKFAVIVVTIALILAVALFEQYVTIMLEAAVQRALILERRLNLELTELISYQYKINHAKPFKYILYLIFIFGTCLFAFFVIVDWDSLYKTLLNIDLSYISQNSYNITFSNIQIFSQNIINNLNSPIGFVFVLVFVLFILSVLALIGIFQFYKYKPRHDREDWTIDKVVCQKGDTVRITLTNLDEKKPLKKRTKVKSILMDKFHSEELFNLKETIKLFKEIEFVAKTEFPEVKRLDAEKDISKIKKKKLNTKIDIRGYIKKTKDSVLPTNPIILRLKTDICPGNNHTWSCSTEEWEVGTYEIYPLRRWPRPLQRKIRIVDEQRGVKIQLK